MLKTKDFDYYLPENQIAQTPVEPRDHSRLFVYERASGKIEHKQFYDIVDYLHTGDLLVVNQTRVIPARLYGQKLPGLGRIEVLLLQKQVELEWSCLIGGSGMKIGRRLRIENGPEAEVIAVLEGAKRIVRFDEAIELFFDKAGHVPLPPYIHGYEGDPERYQTVFNKTPGSAAAPTAGLHFTPELIQQLKDKGVSMATVDLQVGLDTFLPVTEDNPYEHHIHTEWCSVPQETVEMIAQTKANGGRVIAVGTTAVRTLETLAQVSENGALRSWQGDTSLFILPGYQFKVIDGMITNFHLPKSTLLMLVSAFVGRETILALYKTAIKLNYRFFSFGDAMLLL